MGSTEAWRGRLRSWRTRSRLTPVLLFSLALAARLSYWAVRGAQVSPDSEAFIEACGLLADAPLAFLGTYRGLLFSGFLVPFCGVRGIAGGSPEVWVGVQVLVSALSVVLAYDAARRLAGYRAGVVAGLGLAGLFHTFSWSVYLLADTLFVGAVTLALWSVVRHRNQGRTGTRVAALASLGFVAIVRPFGLPLALAWLLADGLPARFDEYRLRLLPRPVALLVAVAGVLGLLGFLVQYQSTLLSNAVLGYYRQGILVHDDPTFTYAYDPVASETLAGFVIANGLDLAIITVLRGVLLFLPFPPRYSTAHILLNLLTYAPLLLGGVIAATWMGRTRSRHALVLLVPLAALTALVSVTWIDFDWRYGAPLGPLLAVLTGYAAAKVPTLVRLQDRIYGSLAAYGVRGRR